jgi:uncharacterized protein (UPF0332 family)
VNDTTRALAVYRMERAREAMKEAGLLLPAGHLNAYVNRLFRNRQEGDYADFVVFQADEVRPWLDETAAFVDYIDGLIAQIGPPTTNA